VKVAFNPAATVAGPVFVIPRFAVTPPPLSQTSPTPLPLVSRWSGLNVAGQLSIAFGIPSPSKSAAIAVATRKSSVSR
jgi:hypothetical protein